MLTHDPWNARAAITDRGAESKEPTMKTRAAVAWSAGQALTIEEVDLDGPRAGEVLIEIKATGICHTDYCTLSGADPEGLFPAILGRDASGARMPEPPSTQPECSHEGCTES